jgi:hypothetical protein
MNDFLSERAINMKAKITTMMQEVLPSLPEYHEKREFP